MIHDVHLLAGQTAMRPAVVNDTVDEGTAVRTGTDSRAELILLDHPSVASVKPGSEAIPSSTDLGTIETPPNSTESPAVDHGADPPR